MQKVIHGNCLEVLRRATPNSIDAIVTDPPYGLSFMGKKWDYDVPSQEIWEECLRVLKPGGYLLAFAGTRTQHRMAVRIEDAGFEIRDMIAWVYGSGFPKSLNIGKAVDKLQGNEREVVGEYQVSSDFADHKGSMMSVENSGGLNKATTVNQTKGASQWEGWGTALKPALEPITVARKPLGEKTVAENCLKWGTGGINIDGCRVETSQDDKDMLEAKSSKNPTGVKSGFGGGIASKPDPLGRFPANFIHDGSDEVVDLFPNSKSTPFNAKKPNNPKTSWKMTSQEYAPSGGFADNGSASRFFYCAKASKSERNKGCEELEDHAGGSNAKGYTEDVARGIDRNAPTKNFHPTVKPIALMEYLVKLVSREGALVLDPFAGSGSTLLACKNLGRGYVGIEMDEEYIKIINARLGNTL